MPELQDNKKKIAEEVSQPKIVGLKGPITKKGLSTKELALLKMAREGQIINCMRLLESEEININCQDEQGNTPLHYALMRKDNDMTWLLLCASNRRDPLQPNIYYKNNHEETLLHLAAKSSNFEIANELLRRDANPFALDKDGYSPLHWAAHVGNLELVKSFVSQGYMLDTPFLSLRSENGATPLSLAIKAGHTEVAAFIKARMKELGASEESIEKSAQGAALALEYRPGVKTPDSIYRNKRYEAIYANGEQLGHHIAYKEYRDGQIIQITEEDGTINSYKTNVLHNPQRYGISGELDGLVCYAFEPVDITKSQRMYVSFRGTDSLESFAADMDPNGPGYELMQKNKEKLMMGVNNITRRMNENMRMAVKEGLCAPKKINVCIAGHSLGGALSQMFCVHLLQAKAIAKYKQSIDRLQGNQREQLKNSLRDRFRNGLSEFSQFNESKRNQMVDDFMKAIEDPHNPLHKASCYDALSEIEQVTLHTQNSAGVHESYDDLATSLAAFFNDENLIRNYNIRVKGDVVHRTCDSHVFSHIPASWGHIDLTLFEHHHDSFLPQIRAHRVNHFAERNKVKALAQPMATFERGYSSAQKAIMGLAGVFVTVLLLPELAIVAVALTLYAVMKPFSALYHRLRYGAKDYSISEEGLDNRWIDYQSYSNANSSCPHAIKDRQQLAAELNDKTNGMVLRGLQRFIYYHTLLIKFVDHTVRHYLVGEPRGDVNLRDGYGEGPEVAYAEQVRQEERSRPSVQFTSVKKSDVMISPDAIRRAKSHLKSTGPKGGADRRS